MSFFLALLQKDNVAAFFGAFVGCVLTSALLLWDMNAAVASALVTAMLCGMLAMLGQQRFSVVLPAAIYSGSFAGMTDVVKGYSGLRPITLFATVCIGLGLFAAIVFTAVLRYDKSTRSPIGAGFGGRLGAVAAIASFAFVQLLGAFGFSSAYFQPGVIEDFHFKFLSALVSFVFCSLGGLTTAWILRGKLSVKGAAVRIAVASGWAFGVMGTLQLLRIPYVIPAFYAGCFLGMASSLILSGWVRWIAGLAILVMVLPIINLVIPHLGGGLGLAAFLSVAVVVLAEQSLKSIAPSFLSK